MANQLRRAVEQKKQFYIERLLEKGIFKQNGRQLYELTLSELQREYEGLVRRKKSTKKREDTGRRAPF